MLYPNGDSTSKDCVSLFLELVKGPPTGKKVLTEFSLGIRNQICDQQQQGMSYVKLYEKKYLYMNF